MEDDVRGGVAVAIGHRGPRVRRKLRRDYREAVERAAWVEKRANYQYGFDVRDHVVRRPPVLTLETFFAARASLARREAVTPAGAGYVVWLAATDPEALAAFWRHAKRDDEAAPSDRGSLEGWNRSFARIERAHARELRRPVAPVVQVPLVVRRPACEVRRGRSARPGRSRRASTSRDDGGSDSSDSDGPAGRAEARRVGAGARS